jgi:hypothetical protein
MSDELRRWQTRIWIGSKMDEPVTIYGESHTKLQEAVRQWFSDNNPVMFGNAPPNYEITQRVNYAHSKEGWHWVRGDADSWAPKQLVIGFDEVADHFLQEAMIVEKGPDFQDLAEGGELHLHLVKTVRRESDERRVNDMLHRGWYLLAIEQEVSTDIIGRETDRRAVFVLGHPEPDAIAGNAVAKTVW